MISKDIRPVFAETLLRGGYYLLLGAGVTDDSTNTNGELLPNTEQLRRDLCALTKAPGSTSLQRVSGLLTDEQRASNLTDRFRGCRPGQSLRYLPWFLWRRIFTFNIDDVLENLYQHAEGTKQQLTPINFDAPFEDSAGRSELFCVHLHGWVGRPGAGYVFSTSEYGRVLRGLNPWMYTLAELLSTEAFIIAGTSLNEVDLEYYLSRRTRTTPRRGRGPSLYIEPSSDVATRADCERYGLVHVPGQFGAFMDWLHAEFPCPPSIADLVVPDTLSMFSQQPSSDELVAFFSDFELVHAADMPHPTAPSRFMFGREPDWSDVQQHLDIERTDNALLAQEIRRRLASTSPEDRKPLVILDPAGTGKTTTLKRVGHDSALAGTPVLSLRTISRIRTRVATQCLKKLSPKVLLLIDGLADHADQIAEMQQDTEAMSHVVMLASERSYRRDYLDQVFGADDFLSRRLQELTADELGQLLERYRRFGLAGAGDAIRDPTRFAQLLVGDPVAVAVCRIMNDFRPLNRIVESLWAASDDHARLPYLCVALCEHCYKVGVRYSVLQGVVGSAVPIGPLFDSDKPLRLTTSAADEEYIVAENSVVGERVLQLIAEKDSAVLLSAFESAGRGLAPHVNRKTIMRRSPEARLAGRLLDCDKVVKPLLGGKAETFYVSMNPYWEWNSRYWEQRALLISERDLATGIQYARHAVALEVHPFPLTTLAKLLLKEMESDDTKLASAYTEASRLLIQAIEMEFRRSRVTKHPFATFLAGTARYLDLGGRLNADLGRSVWYVVDRARREFAADPMIASALRRLEEWRRA